MAWLESHGNLARHPKTRRLMQRMGWTLPFTIGNLHLLWYWALEYAPTGDLTKFTPEDLTYALDLGTATPEQFIEAMIYAGFIDRLASGSAESRSDGTMIESGFLDRTGSGFAESRPGGNKLLLHDWPDYTTKYIRGSKFRRKPEKWLEVCGLYGLPAPKPRQPRNAPIQALQTSLSRPVEAGHGSTFVVPPRRERQTPDPVVPPRRDTALPRIPVSNSGRQNVSTPSQPLPGLQLPPAREGEEPKLAVPPRREGQNPSPSVPPSREPEATQIAIPHILAMEPGFAHTWWPKFLAVYKNHGYPFNAYEAAQALGKLAEHPSKAVNILKHSVKTLTAHPERTRPGWNKNPTAPSGLTNNTT